MAYDRLLLNCLVLSVLLCLHLEVQAADSGTGDCSCCCDSCSSSGDDYSCYPEHPGPNVTISVPELHETIMQASPSGI